MWGRARTLTDVHLRARWVEASCIRLKRDGASFREIARLLTEAGNGDVIVLSRLPEPDFIFPSRYRISAKACHKAFWKAMYRLPNHEAAEAIKLEVRRCEEMYARLAAGIARGNPASMDSALKILERKARVLGYANGPGAAPGQVVGNGRG